ncbi:hypothetical protein AOLI_G00230990 [Acnodon oligacanthus]
MGSPSKASLLAKSEYLGCSVRPERPPLSWLCGPQTPAQYQPVLPDGQRRQYYSGHGRGTQSAHSLSLIQWTCRTAHPGFGYENILHAADAML